jgi:propionaldehyde dehydrogenase
MSATFQSESDLQATLSRSSLPSSQDATSEQGSSPVERAVLAARRASLLWGVTGIKQRTSVIAAVRAALEPHIPALAAMAVDETGLGRVEDKIGKNRLVVEKTPGPEFLRADAYTGDDGHCIIEYAPYGVIGAITPVTNPSETVICNSIAMLSAAWARPLAFTVSPCGDCLGRSAWT